MEDDYSVIEGNVDKTARAYYRDGAYRSASCDAGMADYIRALESQVAALKRQSWANTLGLLAGGPFGR